MNQIFVLEGREKCLHSWVSESVLPRKLFLQMLKNDVGMFKFKPSGYSKAPMLVV